MPIQPFNDSRFQSPVQIEKPTKEGINTFDIDAFRQGVEVRSQRDYSKGVTPRIKPGNRSYDTLASDHQYDFLIFGIAVSIAKTTDEIPWVENFGRFNPVYYINNRAEYPFPIYLNGGREAEFIAKMEIFTIPDNTKENITDFPFYTRRAFGYVVGGNNRILQPEASEQVSQFINLNINEKTNEEFFLEGGYSYNEFGIRVDGYVSNFNSRIKPFSDVNVCDNTQTDKILISKLSFSDPTDSLKLVLENKLQINNDSDLRPNNTKSSAAGITYGAFEAFVGTDSIAFGGFTYLND